MTDTRHGSTFERIDAHHHFWKYDPVQYSWISDQMKVIRRDFLPRDLELEIKSAGVNGVVSVQAQQTMEETWRLLKYVDEYPFILGVVGWVPLISPDLNRALASLAGHPRLRSVRHNLQDDPDPLYMLREDFNRGIAALKPYHLAYDILIFERHLPQTIQFVDRHPDQVFVLDHIAKPRIKAGEISPWRENIRELAKRPHVYCKVSGMVTEADYTHWTEDQLKPYFDVVISAFSPRRLMFGSDWPVCLVAVSYRRWLEVVERAIATLSADERARIWSGTAREAYRL